MRSAAQNSSTVYDGSLTAACFPIAGRAVLVGHGMPPRFLYVGACIVVDAEKERLEGIYLRNFREAAFRRSVIAGARRFTISNTFSRSGASKSMRSGVLRLRISAIWVSVQPSGPKRCLGRSGASSLDGITAQFHHMRHCQPTELSLDLGRHRIAPIVPQLAPAFLDQGLRLGVPGERRQHASNFEHWSPG